MTRGVHTSEFWLSVVGLVVGAVLVICGHSEGQALLAASAVSYPISRGIAKRRDTSGAPTGWQH